MSLRLCDPRAFHRNAGELVALSGSETLAPRLACLDTPHHYVAGAPDGAAGRSLELLSAADVAWTAVEPAGHWPFIDRPAEFAALLARLVRGGADV